MKFYVADLVRHGVSKKKLRDIAARIDSISDGQTLPAIWELAVVWAARTQLGAEIEPNFGGSRPDIFIKGNAHERSIVADVFTASDKEFVFDDLINRQSYVISEIIRRKISNLGINRNIAISVNYKEWDVAVDGRTLRVPSVIREELPKDNIYQIVDRSIIDVEFPIRFHINMPFVLVADIGLYIAPTNSVHGHSTIPNHVQVTQETMLRFLISKCVKQLPDKSAGIRGLIVCDGGGPFMDGHSSTSGFGAVSSREFFGAICNESDIDFIFVLGVRNKSELYRPLYRVKVQNLYYRTSLDDYDLRNVDVTLSKIAGSLPLPRVSGRNARQSILRDSYASAAYNETRVNGIGGRDQMTVRLSARLLSDFLAGKISEKEFRENMTFGQPNPFEGMTIARISFESSELEADDDYVVCDLLRSDIADGFAEVLKRERGPAK